ncbi:MAG TPA: carboxypeptidase regulatory-like domain-containing protein [Thermoanaerobaculia bacterium]|nr:carboxypeptidase regulatory-like domain-containing protein [Thermoanaerobaculia bacterium]
MRYPVTLLLTLALAAAALGAPEAASNKVRAIQPLPEILFFGRIMDGLTGNSVVAAEVTNGTRVVTTDSNGYFNMSLPANRAATLLIRRSGYEPVTQTVQVIESGAGVIVSPAVPAPPVPFTLTPKPTITVRDLNGASTAVDPETFLFGYVLPFASPVTSESASLCRTDGAPFTPDRTEFARIIGPATRVRNSACCTLGDVLAVTVEMKSGERLQASFTDSCAGYEMAIIGRDHVTAQPVSISLANISEIVFP